VTRQVRAFLTVVALIIVGTVSSILTRYYDQLPNDTRPLPALAADLPTSNATARQDFALRIHARFPVGSDERALMQELWAEGFGRPGQNDGRHWASLERHDLVCSKAWTVTWTADDSGHLTAVEGTYIPSCS